MTEDANNDSKSSEQLPNRIDLHALDARDQRSLDVVSKSPEGQPTENPFKNVLKSIQTGEGSSSSTDKTGTKNEGNK